MLWLDADIIVRKDIRIFTTRILRASILSYTQDCDDVKREIGLPSGAICFNPGVLLFNLKSLRKNTPEEQILNVYHYLKDQWVYLDQNVLAYAIQKVQFDRR